MKILHLPVMNAGQPPVVAAAQRRLGHEADTLALRPHAFGYAADRQLDIDQNDVAALFEVLRGILDDGYEVFHFYCRSLLNTGPNRMPAGWDLPLLRALGKTIVFNFRGSDVRMPSVARAVNPHHYFDLLDTPPDELYLRDYLMMVSAYADHVVVPDEELRLYVPWATVIPRAIETSKYKRVGPVRRERPLVVHAPSHRGIKGTELILAAMSRLKARGVKFDFQLIENQPNARCLEIIKGADVVIDQIHLGTYAVLSMEAMAMGKTVLCYLLPAMAPPEGEPWLLNADPQTLETVLTRAVTDYDLRQRVGAAARKRVEDVHEADKVAGELLELYRRPSEVRDPACHRDWPVRASKAWVSASRYQLAECRVQLERNALMLEQAMEIVSAKSPSGGARKSTKPRRGLLARIKRRLVKRPD